MTPLTYSVALYALFCVLLICEFFVPSAGMVGLASFIVALTSIAIAFTHSTGAGFGLIAAVMVSTCGILFGMVHYWPRTPIGRMILNRRPGERHEPVESRTRDGEKRIALVGKLGVAQSNLLPGGLVVIDGKRLDAYSEGSPIDAGTEIVVTSAIAGKLRVRAATRSDLAPEQVKVERSTEAIESSLESLNFDELDS